MIIAIKLIVIFLDVQYRLIYPSEVEYKFDSQYGLKNSLPAFMYIYIIYLQQVMKWNINYGLCVAYGFKVCL